MSVYYYPQKNLTIQGHEKAINQILLLNDGRFVDLSEDKAINFYDKSFKRQFKIEYLGWRKRPLYIYQLKNGEFLTTAESQLLRIYQLKKIDDKDFSDDEEESIDSINKDENDEEIIETKYYILKQKISNTTQGKIFKILELENGYFITLGFCKSYCIWKKNEAGRYEFINYGGKESCCDGILISQNRFAAAYFFQNEVQIWKYNNNNYFAPAENEFIFSNCKPNNTNNILELNEDKTFLFVGGCENIYVINLKEYKIIFQIENIQIYSLILINKENENFLFVSDKEGNLIEYLFENNQLEELIKINDERQKKPIKQFLYCKNKLISVSRNGTINFMQLIEKTLPKKNKKKENRREIEEEDDFEDRYFDRDFYERERERHLRKRLKKHYKDM